MAPSPIESLNSAPIVISECFGYKRDHCSLKKKKVSSDEKKSTKQSAAISLTLLLLNQDGLRTKDLSGSIVLVDGFMRLNL